ncbi:MAG TPA: DUF805 domain-containing protein [Variovorax sp.]|nr:DUF805 domain-containing protein [Variovorax sp.]
MSFVQAVQVCLRKYVDFSGRAVRSEFWWFALFQLIVIVGASMIGETVGDVVALALVLPSLAVGARRLHDIGKSGWFLLLHLLPIIGILVLIFFWVQRGQTESNEYGVSVA